MEIENLSNWTEVIKGFFTFEISHNIWYEIHVLYHDIKFEYEGSTAELYLVGNWTHLPTNVNIFERNKLLSDSLYACIKKAAEHQQDELRE